MRAVGNQHTGTQAFKRGGEIDIQRVVLHQRNIGDTVGVQRNADFQLEGFGFDFLLIHPGFVFTASDAGIADHGVNQ
ncbi:hypothetical protein D3C80_1745580 [compost metagenome]